MTNSQLLLLQGADPNLGFCEQLPLQVSLYQFFFISGSGFCYPPSVLRRLWMRWNTGRIFFMVFGFFLFRVWPLQTSLFSIDNTFFVLHPGLLVPTS